MPVHPSFQLDGAPGSSRPVLLVVSQVVYDEKSESLRPTLWSSIERMCSSTGAAYSVVPPRRSSDIAALVAAADGLLVAGTDATFEQYYGIASPSVEDIMDNLPEVDEVSMAALSSAHERNVPALGICHGAQLMNIALGGSIGFVSGHVHDGEWSEEAHRIDVSSGFASMICFEPTAPVSVNSKHSLACARLGSGLEPAACSDDGALETIWDPELDFFVGVQWHPEFLREHPLAKAVAAAWGAAMRKRAASHWE